MIQFGICNQDYTPSPHHLRPYTILQDRYVIGRVLGEGGFGITYLGFDRLLERRVAIKEYFPVLHCTRNTDAGNRVIVLQGFQAKLYAHSLKKYLGEARLLAKMEKQSAIVDVLDYFEENNTAYIVMEYIEGIVLKEFVEGEGRISEMSLFSLMEPLLDSLTVLHSNGILHRDICPENLILERIPDSAAVLSPSETDSLSNGLSDLISFRLRLIDFGSARDEAALRETQTITLRHGFAPIEQYQKEGGQGPWTDIYALCATMYFCLTGIVPPMATDRITSDNLRLPADLGVDVSPDLQQTLLKGLQVRPHRRFNSVKDLYDALTKCRNALSAG